MSKLVLGIAAAMLVSAQTGRLEIRERSGAGFPGDRLAGSTLWAVSGDCRQSWRLIAREADNFFELPAGKYLVYASGAVIDSEPVQAEAAAGQTSSVELEVRAGVSDSAGKPVFRPWRIRVVDVSGQPVAGASVQFSGVGKHGPSGFLSDHRSGAQGEVNLCRMRGERAMLTVTCAGCTTVRTTVSAPRAPEQVVIRVRRSAAGK